MGFEQRDEAPRPLTADGDQDPSHAPAAAPKNDAQRGGAPRESGGEPPSHATASPPADVQARVAALEREVAAANARVGSLEQRIDADRAAARDFASRRVENARRATVDAMRRMRHDLRNDIGRTRSRIAVPDAELAELDAYRDSPEYARIYEIDEPLVSVVVATYNRAETLTRRCLPSLLAQDYANLEIIVVSDGSTDDTEARVQALADERITFVEVGERTVPAHIGRGADALNLGRSVATGDLLTHLDDDDEYDVTRIGRLVRFMQESRAELVWHPFWWQESAAAEWSVNDATQLELGQVTNGSIIHLAWFGRVRMDPLARRYRDAGDWSLVRTIRDIGVKARRYPVPLLRHYLERQNPRLAESLGDRGSWVNLQAFSRTNPLVPDLDSEARYREVLAETGPWQRAVDEIGMRTGLRTKGLLRADADARFPTLATSTGLVVTLYGPYRDGRKAFERDVHALESASRVDGSLVPRSSASGSLNPDWSFLVTTAVPGVPLSSVRADLGPADLADVARWLSGVVMDLHSAPLTDEERADGWSAFEAELSERHARLERTLDDRATLPPHLRSEVRSWLPSIVDLAPDPEIAVTVHGRLDDGIVRGIWHRGRYDPTGLSDVGLARVGHPSSELGDLFSAVFRGDASLLQAFLGASSWPLVGAPDFARHALAFVLLGDVDHLAGTDIVEGVDDLDSLAERMFGGRPSPSTSAEA